MALKDCTTTPELITALAREEGNRIALVDSEETLTFALLQARIEACAIDLLRRGFGRGDRIGILMGNTARWLISAMAIQAIGGTAVTMNTWFKPRELAYVAGHAGLDAIVATPAFNGVDYRELLNGLAGDALPRLRSIVYTDEPLSTANADARALLKALSAQIDPESAAYLLYTSGSTAAPKGVPISHRALIDISASAGVRLGFSRDRIFLPISLFWAAGCLNATMAAWTSASAVVLQEKFDVEQSFAMIDRHRCTGIFAAEKMLLSMMAHAEFGRVERSFLRKGMISGSSTMVRQIVDGFLPDACQAYGLTETHGFVVAGDVRDDAVVRIASHGRPLPGVSVRIVDPSSDQGLEAGAKGEIRVKGPFRVDYLDDPAATALAHDADGYFRTGDIGFLDEGGYLHFEGRLKEVLKIDGMNVSPAEVESVLQEHPLVAEVYVTGVRLSDKEEIGAVIVPADGGAIDPDQLQAFCRTELAAYKRPRHFLLTQGDRIPLTSSGKVHRAALAGLFDAAQATP